MKKTSSFHLEEDIFDEIIKYQKENNLSSRNIALERMILEYKNIKKELEDKSSLVEFAKSILANEPSAISNINIQEAHKHNDREEKEESKPKNSKLRGSIKSVFENMPDKKDNE